MFDAVRVETSGYYLPEEVISRKDPNSLNALQKEQGCRFPVTAVNDNIDCTCVNITQGDMHLQAVLNFSLQTMGHRLSVEVILKQVDDCRSPVWNWFVESKCQEGNIAECAIVAVDRWSVFSRCVVTCVCWASCDYLYFKYNQPQYQTQYEEQLCEIRLLHNWQHNGPLCVEFMWTIIYPCRIHLGTRVFEPCVPIVSRKHKTILT